MAKKDYVLINALKGDLDALENILGRIYAPNFDLAFHVSNDEEIAQDCVKQALMNTRDLILTGDLDGRAPIYHATAFTLAALEEIASKIDSWNQALGDVKDQDGLILLTHLSLGVQGNDLDSLFDLDYGAGDALVAKFLAESGMSDDEWGDVLDKHGATVSLPKGIIDSLIDDLED